jgi:sortase A
VAAAGQRRRQIRRAVVVAAIACVLLVVAVVAFQGPLAHVWYQARQQNLAGDLNAKRPRSHKGQSLGVLQIPKINLNLVVVEGDGPTELRGGPGHRIGTPVPGRVGNSLIFGHHSGWGAPFSKLGQLQPKDQIVIQARGQQAPILFQVTSVARVDQGDVHLFAPSDDHRVTIVTATGGRFSTKRLVITAVSGDVGKLLPAGRPLAATSAHGSNIFNATLGLFLLLVAVSVVAARELGRRHRPIVVAIVVIPLALGAWVALFLELDLALFPPLH